MGWSGMVVGVWEMGRKSVELQHVEAIIDCQTDVHCFCWSSVGLRALTARWPDDAANGY